MSASSICAHGDQEDAHTNAHDEADLGESREGGGAGMEVEDVAHGRAPRSDSGSVENFKVDDGGRASICQPKFRLVRHN